MDNTVLASLWFSIAQMEPRQIVGRLSHFVTDERVQQGYVGRNFAATGILLLGMNPTGDTTGDSSESVYEAIAGLDGSTLTTGHPFL